MDSKDAWRKFDAHFLRQLVQKLNSCNGREAQFFPGRIGPETTSQEGFENCIDVFRAGCWGSRDAGAFMSPHQAANMIQFGLNR
mmetsp:Transcript_46067/g.107682  ORF Transcript_46067/g.107682 Transcript_46067/m.107682 type:complete len:84 (-) Transcript_46067:443-694(-)